MKKYLALFLTMVMGASVLAGCGGSDSAKTFTVGFDAEYPPYGYRTESGDYAGLIWIWLLRSAKKRLGAGKAAHRLGCKGYGAEQRCNRLYLERLHYDRQRG